MTSATVTQRFRGLKLEVEHVILTITDAYTHVVDMSKPQFCQITSAEDMAAETNATSYTISGRTITFYADGVSSKKIAVSIYGYK